MDRILFIPLFRLIFATLFITVALVDCSAQKGDEALIYCRDGSIYRGKIISENGKTIRIVDFAKDTLLIAESRVKKIKKASDYLIHSNGKLHKTKGFYWGINIGFNAANVFTSDDYRSEHFEVMFGWRFNKRWSIANGIGSEFNSSRVGGFPIETVFSSFFLHGRYYITDNRQRLFAYSRIGFGVGATEENELNNNNNKGGIQWQGGAGVHFASRKKARFIISLGYYLQKTNGSQLFLDDFGNEVKIDYNLLITRPVFKLGIEFR